jgi:hypothetical protein
VFFVGGKISQIGEFVFLESEKTFEKWMIFTGFFPPFFEIKKKIRYI